MNEAQSIIKVIFICLICNLLLGCLNVAVTGAQVAYGHDRITKTFKDHYITTQAYRKLYKDTTQFDDDNIAVSTFHRTVLLTGQVTTSEKQKQAEQIIKTIPDVEKIYNLTQISSPTSSLIRISDCWITSKIKTKLIAMNDINPDEIKVITENGTVYLMGMVQPQAADIAVDVARTTEGVQNVVKVFTYLRISKT